MKLELWQALSMVTWVTVILGVLFASAWPGNIRIGGAMVLLGIFISFGRSALPRPELREHVPNDQQLQRWNDVLMFGPPAFFLVSIGAGILFYRAFFLSGLLVGFLSGFAFIVGYGCLVFTRDIDAGA